MTRLRHADPRTGRYKILVLQCVTIVCGGGPLKGGKQTLFKAEELKKIVSDPNRQLIDGSLRAMCAVATQVRHPRI
jgi:hypothetical protein